MITSKRVLMLATTALLALAACSPGHEDGRIAGQLPEHTKVPGQTILPIAGAHGLQDNLYFNDELQQARARVDAMRTEMETLSGKLAALQDKVKGLASDAQVVVPVSTPGAPIAATTTTTAPDGTVVEKTTVTTGPEVVPANTKVSDVAETLNDGPIATGPTAMTTQSADAMPPVAATTTTQTTTTTAAPTPIMGEMAKPVDEKATPVKAVEAKKDIKNADAKPAAKGGVSGVRFGTHGDTVRVVLDVNGSAEGAKPELDNANNILTISLPNTKWSATATQKVTNNPVIASYSAQPSADGSVAAFALKGATKIVSSSVMKNPTRVVVDLSK